MAGPPTALDAAGVPCEDKGVILHCTSWWFSLLVWQMYVHRGTKCCSPRYDTFVHSVRMTGAIDPCEEIELIISLRFRRITLIHLGIDYVIPALDQLIWHQMLFSEERTTHYIGGYGGLLYWHRMLLFRGMIDSLNWGVIEDCFIKNNNKPTTFTI